MDQPIQPIDSAQHRNHGFASLSDLSFTREQTLCPVSGAEITQLLPFYTLAFIKSNGRFDMVALMGLNKGENLLLSPQSRWLFAYIPARFRGYPFELAVGGTATEPKAVLCFDHRSGLYREEPNVADGERRFFHDDGQPTEHLKSAVNFLASRHKVQEATRKGVTALADAGLLESWNFGEELEGVEAAPTGLYRINQKALKAVSPDGLHSLQSQEALALAYAQMFSMPRLGLLNRLAQLKRESAEREAPSADLVEELFGQQDDTLKFNF